MIILLSDKLKIMSKHGQFIDKKLEVILKQLSFYTVMNSK